MVSFEAARESDAYTVDKWHQGAGNVESRVVLLDGDYTIDETARDTHLTYADIVANEIAAAGYTAQGYAMANKRISVDSANDEANYLADDVTCGSPANGTEVGAAGIIAFDSGTPTNSALLQVIDLKVNSNPRVASGDPFIVRFANNRVYSRRRGARAYISSALTSTFTRAKWHETTGNVEVRAVLLAPTYVVNDTARDTHFVYNDVVAHEITPSSGYNATGYALTGKAIVVNDATNETFYNANDVTCGSPAIGVDVRWVALIEWKSGDPLNSALLEVADLRRNGLDRPTTGDPFIVKFPSNRVWSRRAAA